MTDDPTASRPHFERTSKVIQYLGTRSADGFEALADRCVHLSERLGESRLEQTLNFSVAIVAGASANIAAPACRRVGEAARQYLQKARSTSRNSLYRHPYLKP